MDNGDPKKIGDSFSKFEEILLLKDHKHHKCFITVALSQGIRIISIYTSGSNMGIYFQRWVWCLSPRETLRLIEATSYLLNFSWLLLDCTSLICSQWWDSLPLATAAFSLLSAFSITTVLYLVWKGTCIIIAYQRENRFACPHLLSMLMTYSCSLLLFQ